MTDRLAAYLQRLGLAVPPPATLEGLAAVHRAHVSLIPYDNLSIMLGRPDPTDQDACVGRVVSEHRLGYCFQQNAALAWLLEKLGFEVSSRVGHLPTPADRPLRPDGADHVALVVSGLATEENPAGHWWADAGLGEGFVAPLPLTDGHHLIDGWSFGITATDGDPRPSNAVGPSTWHFRHRDGGTPPHLELSSRHDASVAIAEGHRRLSLGADSRFRQKLVVLRNEGGRLLSVRGCVMTELSLDGRDQRDLTTFEEWRRVLVDDLLLPLHDTEDGELEALWTRTALSHRAWDAAGRP